MRDIRFVAESITRKRYSRLILTEGKFADAKVREFFGMDSGLTALMVLELYNNTNKLVRAGQLPIVKIGHGDADPRNKGMVDSLRLTRVPLPSGRTGYGIEAGFWLNEPWAEEYEKGLYPNASIEADDFTVDDSGKDLGWILNGFAIFGNEQPGVAGLPRIFSAEGVEVVLSAKAYERKVAQMSKIAASNKSQSKFKQALAVLAGRINAAEVSPDAFDELLNACTAIMEQTKAIRDGGEDFDPSKNLDEIDAQCAMIMEWAEKKKDESGDESDSGDESGDSGEPEAKKEDDMDKGAAASKTELADMQRQLDELKAANKEKDEALETLALSAAAAQKEKDEKEARDVFASLQDQGCVVAQDWEEFLKISASVGLSRARDLYAHKNRPNPNQPQLPKGTEPTPENLELASLIDRFENQLGYDHAEAEKRAKFALEQGHYKAGVN